MKYRKVLRSPFGRGVLVDISVLYTKGNVSTGKAASEPVENVRVSRKSSLFED